MFLVGNGLGLALALYKCQAMGLLPTRPSDWLAFVTPPQVSPGSWGHPAESGLLGCQAPVPRTHPFLSPLSWQRMEFTGGGLIL